MNKAQLIDLIVKEKVIDITSKSSAERVLNAVLSAIEKGLKKDKMVQLVGFGTFVVKNRKSRLGTNPRTGDKIKIKSSRTVSFKVGKILKDSV